MELDIKKIDKLERKFLQKSISILNKKKVSKKDVNDINEAFEKYLNKVGAEPLVIYRTAEIILKGTGYSLNSTLEENVEYMKQIIIQENNNTFKVILVGTISKIVVAERVTKAEENKDGRPITDR